MLRPPARESGTASMLPDAILDQLRERHSGPDRGYHGWSHPLALLDLYSDIEHALDVPLAVRCAILFHDAIYEPRAADNEHRSAALARELLSGVIPDDSLERVVRLIESTARHAIPEGLPAREAADMALFLDLDLSILAASDQAFDAYEAGVRHEYREVPDAAFRAGRAAILQGFLERNFLYLSDWGRRRFEAKARENLKRSIEQLSTA